MSAITSTLPMVRSAKLRVLSVTSAGRLQDSPDIPKVSEFASPGFKVDSWEGLLWPKALAVASVSPINAAVASIVQQPDVVERFHASGIVPDGMSAQDFAAQIRREIVQWRALRPSLEFIHSSAITSGAIWKSRQDQ